MNIKHINTINELPRNTPMVLYHAPYFAITRKDEQSEEEWGLDCSAHEFRQKHGEPGTIFVYKSNLFFVKEDK